MRNHEKWMELCELASKELDSEKLMTLVAEINRLMEEKNRKLRESSSRQDGAKNHQAEPG